MSLVGGLLSRRIRYLLLHWHSEDHCAVLAMITGFIVTELALWPESLILRCLLLVSVQSERLIWLCYCLLRHQAFIKITACSSSFPACNVATWLNRVLIFKLLFLDILG